MNIKRHIEFIKQTAIDYGLSEQYVEQMYRWYWSTGEFYNKLEEKLKELAR